MLSHLLNKSPIFQFLSQYHIILIVLAWLGQAITLFLLYHIILTVIAWLGKASPLSLVVFFFLYVICPRHSLFHMKFVSILSTFKKKCDVLELYYISAFLLEDDFNSNINCKYLRISVHH